MWGNGDDFHKNGEAKQIHVYIYICITHGRHLFFMTLWKVIPGHIPTLAKLFVLEFFNFKSTV